MIGRLALYARTARHLRPVQLAYWPLRRAQRALPVRSSAPEPAHAARLDRLAAVVAGWGPGDADRRIASADRIVAGEFRFLNHAEHLPSPDWNRRYVGQLWSMNLHYFAYAVDLAWAWRSTGRREYVDRLTELLTGWIGGTEPGRGDAWEPYSICSRVVNWLYALLLAGEGVNPRVRAAVLESVFAQADFLDRRLEVHLQANHLQANLRGLFVASLAFDGRRSSRWRARAEAGLWRELRRQVLPDGTHYERTPTYHAIFLADYLEVLDLMRGAGSDVPGWVPDQLGAMANALGALCRPDGRMHLFNDSADGIAPPLDEISAHLRALLDRSVTHPDGGWSLPAAGYFGHADDAAGERLIVDCGEPAAPCQPGHAHCDMLSFELDLGGRPVITDSGVRGYIGDPWREYVRSTRAHNTVMIGGREQSEVWSTYRLARRAQVRAAAAAAEGDTFRFRGACSPYHAPRATHVRDIVRAGGTWTVTDRVDGADGAPVRSFLHFHPDFTLEVEGTTVVARAPDLTVEVRVFGVDGLCVVRGRESPRQGWFCREFGTALPASVLEMNLSAQHAREFGYAVRCVDGGSRQPGIA